MFLLAAQQVRHSLLRQIMGKIRFKIRAGSKKAPTAGPSKAPQRGYRGLGGHRWPNRYACARTWSEAFSHACPGPDKERRQETQEQRGPPASRDQGQGSTSNERFCES